MNSILKIFSPQLVTHQNRQYAYFSQEEIDINKASNDNTLSCFLLSQLVAVKIHGQEANTFLQGQLTIDVEASPSSPIGLYLSRKGRIISLFYLIKHQNNFYLLMPQDISAVFVNQLKKYVFNSKVTIEILTDSVVSFKPELFEKFKDNFLTNTPILSFDKQILSVLNESQLKQLHQSHLEQQFEIKGDWYWHKEQLHMHIPSIYSETIAKFLVHDLELHLKGAVNFEKGCFIGQEIVARMHYKAKLNYHLKIVTLSSRQFVEPGQELIINDKKEGIVIDGLTDLNKQNIYLVCQKKAKQ